MELKARWGQMGYLHNTDGSVQNSHLGKIQTAHLTTHSCLSDVLESVRLAKGLGLEA